MATELHSYIEGFSRSVPIYKEEIWNYSGSITYFFLLSCAWASKAGIFFDHSSSDGGELNRLQTDDNIQKFSSDFEGTGLLRIPRNLRAQNWLHQWCIHRGNEPKIRATAQAPIHEPKTTGALRLMVSTLCQHALYHPRYPITGNYNTKHVVSLVTMT